MNTATTTISEQAKTRSLLSPETIGYYLSDWAAEINRFRLCSRILESIGTSLSHDVHFSPAVYIQVSVSDRADLQALMTLAPRWEKTPGDNGITYSALVEGERFQIVAKQAALPQTCKMVEEEYDIPAVEAKPASVGKRMVLKCDNPEALAVEAHQEGDL